MLTRTLCLSAVTCLLATQEAAEPLPSYSGEVELPVALRTANGIVLERGYFDIEVRFEKEQPVLAFSSGDEIKAVVNGRPRGDQDEGLDLSSPLVGTIFMRSSANPIGTEEERHFSKTGLPQYQEEGREWTATMRVYKLSDPKKKEVYFAFQKRGEAGVWSRTDFQLFPAAQ